MRSELTIDTAWHPLVSGNPPAWASEWGQDRRSVFVAFTLDGVTQHLRWIRPGRFLMGSPEDEPGRFEDEGPQYSVTFVQGFWLFETPCTQALWEVVMGHNPSAFKSPNRPVEKVSWKDVQAFLQKINARIPGLNLTLPSEAQWEYACRAGTETALYNGPIEILGVNNAPALDLIAWYRGNSGENYELSEGFDSSDWDEKQYPHRKTGSRPVKKRKYNAWGVYDMLGNVLEWVEDGWHENYDGAPSDGSPWQGGLAGGSRVIRGGSWNVGAGSCRSAYRNRGGATTANPT